jgi:hypothetical protein
MADGYSYVALLDVLGYRSHVKKDRDHGRLDFKDKLTEALGVLRNINEDEVRSVTISDTVILSTSNPVGLRELMSACSLLFVSFMRHGLLLRGGIAYSQHFHSGNVTYSHALTLAHGLESENAIWPRILIASGALDASLANGADLRGDGLIISWNGVNILNILHGVEWTDIYRCVSEIYENEKSQMPEDVFTKFVLFERFMMNHPSRPRRVRPFIDSMVAV